MSGKHLLYIVGMPEPFAVPDDAFDVVRRAIIDGAEARWEDNDGILTRVNFGAVHAVRFVPSDDLREETLYLRAKRREEWAERERKLKEQRGE